MDDEKCTYCEHSSDIENFSNKQSLGWRVFITIVSWLILGAFIPNGKFYFSTMILFITPLAVDYMKFTPQKSKGRVLVKKIALCICMIFSIFCFCGLSFMYIKNIDKTQYIVIDNSFVILKNLKFPVRYLWISLIVFPVFTIIDYFAHSTVGELNLLNTKSKTA